MAMNSQVESVDISSIRAAALAPLELPHADFDNYSRNDHLQPAQNEVERSAAAGDSRKPLLTRARARGDDSTSQPVVGSESLTDLPSTVPDSQVIANVEQILEEVPNATLPEVMEALKKMSQGAPQDTQPLSPEFVENMLKSRRSTACDQGTGYTYATLHEGDKGHIDLTSSYRPQEIVVDENESEPVDVEFSPTQSAPNGLSQFPESQRFKTPATVGKKRNYNGDVVESPALPRNPLARRGQPTPAGKMGLSQAFAATQAASSPFVNGLRSELPSDRPSPAFAIQPRPTTATDSSPLQRRTQLPRSSTEPQTKYISIEESQARREARRRIDTAAAEESDDSFFETTDDTRRFLAKQRRDAEAQRQFEAMSSIGKLNGPRSSPVRRSKAPPTSSSPLSSPARPINGHLYSDPTSPAEVPDGPAHSSEEETEQEDEEDLALRNSSQVLRRTVPEEDKENAPHGAVQIPVTAELHRIMVGPAAEVGASPSIRHSNDVVPSYSSSQMHEDGEALVANSQPSQRRRYIIDGPKLPSSGEQTDFVPQSQFPPNSIREELRRRSKLIKEDVNSGSKQTVPGKPNLLMSNSDTRSSVAEPNGKPRLEAEAMAEEDEDEEPPRRNLRSQPATHTLASTIPETSSARLRGGVSSSTEHQVEAIRSMSEFETARTHPHDSVNKHDSAPAALPSQSTASISPSRNKRKRMDEIDAEESQNRSGGPDLGEFNPTLLDPDMQDVMSSSPIRPGRRARRPRLEASSMKVRQDLGSSPVVTSANDSVKIGGVDRQELRTTQGETPPSSEEALQVHAPRRGLHRPRIAANNFVAKPIATHSKARSKPSGWDIQASPETPALTCPALRGASLQTHSSTFPAVEVCSLSSARPRRASTQHANAFQAETHTSAGSKPRGSRANVAQRLNDQAPSAHNALADALFTPAPTGVDHSAPLGKAVAPNQVLACFNGKSRAYYPASCLGVNGTNTPRYQVQWDGYEPDELDEHGVRSLDLRYGDNIKVNLKGFPKTAHVIRGFKDQVDINESAVTDVRGYKTLLVTQKQRKTLPADATIDNENVKEVPISAIYVDSNMWNQFKDRPFIYVALPTLLSSARPDISTPLDRSSTPSTPGSRSRRLAASTANPPTAPVSTGSGRFVGMAFAISYEDNFRRSAVTDLVRSNGGLVLHAGFHELFSPSQTTLKSQYITLGFTALLADRHSTREKYLQALALGLPCLSGKWIEACISAEALVDWQSYLLPAGESDELEGAVRSRILPSHDPQTIRVDEVVRTSGLDLLKSEPGIFIVGRGKAEAKRRPYIFLTKVLGAGEIEKVSDIQAAKLLFNKAEGKQYKWVFVDDREIEAATELFAAKKGRRPASGTDVRIISSESIKQSLVFGKVSNQ